MFVEDALDASVFFPHGFDTSDVVKEILTDAQRQFAKDFTTQLQKDGFVRLRRHTIDPGEINKMFDSHKYLFDLSMETKLSLLYPGGATPARGFTPSGREKTYLHKPELSKASSEGSESREQFTIGPPEDHSFPTPWPAITKGSPAEHHHDAIRSFYAAFRAIASRLIYALEIGLGVEQGTISNHCGGDASEMTLNFYPPAPVRRLQSRSLKRIWPHSDLGIISLLVNDGQGGLEFEDRASPGRWIPVEPRSRHGEEIVIIASDTLERWTNAIILAGVHRVGVPKGLRTEHAMEGREEPEDVDDGQQDSLLPARRSFVMLYRAKGSTAVGPLHCFVTPQRPPKYDNMTAAEYLHMKNVLTFGRGEKKACPQLAEA